MEMNSFAVVEFPCDDDDGAEVEVVPCLWLFNDNSKCYWPNLKSSEKISKLVSARSVPSDSWRTYDVSRVYVTCDNYLEARSKANRAVVSSDVNTDAGSRRRFAPRKLSTTSVTQAKRSKPKQALRKASESSDDTGSDLESLPMTPPTLPPRPGLSASAAASNFTPAVVTKKPKILPTIQNAATPASDSGSVVSMRSSNTSDFDQPVGVQEFYGQGSAKGNAKVVENTSKEWLKQANNRIKQRKDRQPSSPVNDASGEEFEEVNMFDSDLWL